MLILQKGHATVVFLTARGHWKWISPRALKCLAPALLSLQIDHYEIYLQFELKLINECLYFIKYKHGQFVNNKA